MKREVRFPTIIGLVVLVISLIAGVFLTKKSTTFSSKASGDCQPVSLQVTNLTHTSFDVSFLTSDPCLSTLDINQKIISDARLSTDPHKVHYFKVDNLKENTEYRFKIIAGGAVIEDSSFNAKTGSPPKNNTPTSNLAWGKTFNPDLTPATNAVVYLVIPGALPLSAFVTSNGYWNISLANSFNEQKNNWFTPPDNIQEDIIVISDDSQVTQVVNFTSRNNPVPDIIIGQNQLFATQPTDPDTGQIGSIDQSSPSGPGLSINNPNENETLSATKPDFFGTAPLNSQINILVESSESIQGEAAAGTDGIWHWSPPSDLAPGDHTITISYIDPITQQLQSIKRNFKILPSLDALAFSSSPSATLAPSPTPTVSSPTPLPTTIITATPTPTVSSPTATPSPIVRTVKPSTDSGVPTTGNIAPTILLVITALALLIFSFTFFQ